MPRHGRARSSEHMGGACMVEALHRRADGEDLHIRIERGTDGSGHLFRMRLHVAHGNVIVPAQGAVVVAVPVAVVVPPLAILGPARFQPELACVRMKAKIIGAQVDLTAGLHTGDLTPAVTIGSIEPAVQPPGKAVDQMLGIACCKTLEPRLALVAPAIPIRVPRIDDIGDGGDEDAAFPEGQPRGVTQSVQEERGLIVHMIPVRILQDLDAARLHGRHRAPIPRPSVVFSPGAKG